MKFPISRMLATTFVFFNCGEKAVNSLIQPL